MTPSEFRAAIRELGYTQEGFAVAVGAGRRSGQRWATESVPPVVATIVRLMQERRDFAEALAKKVQITEDRHNRE